jgi:4-hydroxybenzoate polyprenyltransferase
MRPILRLLRPGDWIKNVFVLVPLIFWLPGAGRGIDSAEIAAKMTLAAIAFAAFCLASSGWYAINDVLDAKEDRLHPVKRNRPVASGRIPAALAALIGIGLATLAIVVATQANSGTMWVVVAYIALQGGYNLGLKRLIFIDAATIASGFCMRAIAGAVAIAAPVSIWLILCVFFLTLYLAFIKRQCDLSSASRMQATQWKPRAKYGDLAELNWLLSVSGGLTVLMFLMYTLSAHAQGIFGGRSFGLALLTPIVLIVVHRFYRRAMQGLSDSPLDAIRSDPIVAAAMTIFIVGVYGILYVTGVEEFLRRALLI